MATAREEDGDEDGIKTLEPSIGQVTSEYEPPPTGESGDLRKRTLRPGAIRAPSGASGIWAPLPRMPDAPDGRPRPRAKGSRLALSPVGGGSLLRCDLSNVRFHVLMPSSSPSSSRAVGRDSSKFFWKFSAP